MATQPIRHMPQNREAGTLTPAFTSPAESDMSTANLPVFNNPVVGNIDTGVTHTGDLGGAGN